MEYQILDVSTNNLDHQSMRIVLDLQPTRWERWFQKIPQGRTVFLGHEQQWYFKKNFHPVPRIITRVLFTIAYDHSYRHLQQPVKSDKHR